MMTKLSRIRQKTQQYLQLIQHFRNPVLALLARLRWIDASYCSWRIRKGALDYNILGRASGGDLWILREVLVEETYRQILDLLPSGPIRFVDIGSHIGAFTIWLHAHRSVSESFCFEPDPDSFMMCQFNIGQAGCRDVRLYNQALGGSTRTSQMWVDRVTSARSSIYKRETSSSPRLQSVQVLALKEWLDQVDGDFDLLKMDCEGSEWEILDACPAVFTRFSVVVAEIHGDPSGSRNIDDFAAALAETFTSVPSDRLYIGKRNVSVAIRKSVADLGRTDRLSSERWPSGLKQ